MRWDKPWEEKETRKRKERETEIRKLRREEGREEGPRQWPELVCRTGHREDLVQWGNLGKPKWTEPGKKRDISKRWGRAAAFGVYCEHSSQKQPLIGWEVLSSHTAILPVSSWINHCPVLNIFTVCIWSGHNMQSAIKEDSGKVGHEGTWWARVMNNACILGILRVPVIPNTSSQQEQRCQDFERQM